jgi:hypothetical protein
LGTFIDWRGVPTVHSAVGSLGLVPLNLIVWAKTNAGMGSLYRSQHELLPLFKKGTALHVNNVELGKRGRWRSNVWTRRRQATRRFSSRPARPLSRWRCAEQVEHRRSGQIQRRTLSSIGLEAAALSPRAAVCSAEVTGSNPLS